MSTALSAVFAYKAQKAVPCAYPARDRLIYHDMRAYASLITARDCGASVMVLFFTSVLPIAKTVSPVKAKGADCSFSVGFTAIRNFPLLKMKGYFFFLAYTTSKPPSD